MDKFSKVISAQEAAGLIQDGDTVAINGMGWVGNPALFFKTLEQRFINTGYPKDITLFSSCGVGGRQSHELANRLAYEGMVGRVICGHYDSMRDFFPLIEKNKIEAYNLPQGIMSLNLHNAVRRSPGLLTKIGLKTSVDPRLEGGSLNEVSRQKYVEVVNFNGEEFLFFKTIYLNVCVIRGTTADINGNITFEKEALQNDALVTAQAVHNNGGKVIVQVERLSDSHANPQMVKIPTQLVDAIYLDPDQMQTGSEIYNSLYSGEIYAPMKIIEENMLKTIVNGEKMEVKRREADRIIARRAGLELRKGDVVNLGIGIPTSIGVELCDIGQLNLNDVTFSVELGMMGGVPAGEVAFGTVINADAIYNQAAQFEFYEGGGLNIAFVGALEIDRKGNVNVTKIGNKLFGLGGFNHVAETSKRVVVCSKFMKGSGYKHSDGDFYLFDGDVCKLVDQVEHISFSSERALEKGQKVLYITERGVFALSQTGLMLMEISPYVDLEKDILSHLKFQLKISPELKMMDPICFKF